MTTVGAIGYECHSGLGHLARDFFQAGVVQRAFVIPHPRYEPQSWFGRARYDRLTLGQFLGGLDWLLLLENAFSAWDVVRKAKARGVKVAIVVMYEWSEFPPRIVPDLVLCPSLLDVDYYRDWCAARGVRCVFLPVPVRQAWRLRERAELFVHNAGHGQVGYAKGTPELLQAWQHVRSPARLVVRGQPDEPRVAALFRDHAGKDPRVTFTLANLQDEDLFSAGDVFINAERYNGLSLPLQEAHAAGMVVMTSDRYPANTWLPRDPLVPVAGYERHRVNQTEFDRATIDPLAIAAKVDEYYGRDVAGLSVAGKLWGEAHSWEKLGARYREALGAT